MKAFEILNNVLAKHYQKENYLYLFSNTFGKLNPRRIINIRYKISEFVIKNIIQRKLIVCLTISLTLEFTCQRQTKYFRLTPISESGQKTLVTTKFSSRE